jgi:hypothetical protein
MPALPEEYLEIHREADKREPKLETATRSGLKSTGEDVDVDAVELALGAGDVAAVMALFPLDELEAELEALEGDVVAAWLEGGDIGVGDVDELRDELPDDELAELEELEP